ncbi:hypothetical protein FB451DRAFT_1566104 [Mycena latifolia]|nr:hypothetical protein FB451DRAFT_1566104 [Mycena latifolia]
MPAELPGFYFDRTRNRYFPISSRPPPVAAPPPTPPAIPEAPRRRRRVLWSAAPLHHAPQARISESLLLTRLAGTRCGHAEPVRWPIGETTLCAFRTATAPDADGRKRQFLGDARGWVYSRTSTSSLTSSSEEGEAEDEEEWTPWAPELCLHPASEISALCTAGSRCVAVCFGPATKICVQDVGVPGRTYLLSLSAVRDVRAASLQDNALVLGAARTAVLLADIDAATVRTLDTGGSDVFAVAQQGPLIYAGTRAGTAHRFDARLPSKHAHALLPLDTSFNTSNSTSSSVRAPASSIVAVHPTRVGTLLVVARADGRLASYDLRFPREPAVTYVGHVGALAGGARLGVALDPTERVLFAAGADRRLRAWAVGSGVPVHDTSVYSTRDAPSAGWRAHDASNTAGSSSAHADPARSPFAARFPAPLSALQAVDADGGTELWAGGGGEVWSWRLGV